MFNELSRIQTFTLDLNERLNITFSNITDFIDDRQIKIKSDLLFLSQSSNIMKASLQISQLVMYTTITYPLPKQYLTTKFQINARN